MRRNRHGTGMQPVLGIVYVFSVVLLSLLAGVVAVFVGDGAARSFPELNPTREPVLAKITSANITHSMGAKLQGSYRQSSPLRANGAVGVVTGVDVKPGGKIKPGQIIFHVGGVPIRSYVSKIVFYRLLNLKDTGDDVSAAQKLLKSLLPEQQIIVDGVVGANMVKAVKVYEKEFLGVATPVGVFDPAWFIRVPVKNFPVGKILVSVGMQYPALGEVVVEASRQLSKASLEIVGQDSLPVGKYNFACAGREIKVVKQDVAGQDDTAQSGVVWRVKADKAAAQLLGTVPADGSNPQCEGVVSAAEPDAGLGVPASALVYSDTGSTACLIVPEKDSFVAQKVEVLESSIDGLAILASSVSEGLEVVVNPGDIAPLPPCR